MFRGRPNRRRDGAEEQSGSDSTPLLEPVADEGDDEDNIVVGAPHVPESHGDDEEDSAGQTSNSDGDEEEEHVDSSDGDDDEEDDVHEAAIEDLFVEDPTRRADGIIPTLEQLAVSVAERVLRTVESGGGITRDSDEVVRNIDEVVSLVGQIEAAQNSYERLNAERAAAIVRDPHNAMDSERIARVNRHFLSRVLPEMREAFMGFMASDWYTLIDSSLIAPCRMITLINSRLQEILDSQEDAEPVVVEGRVSERIVSICGNSESSSVNLMAVFTALNSAELLPISDCEYPDLRGSFPEFEEEEAITEFPFSDPDIVTAANRILLSLKYRLLQEIISNARDAIDMGLDADDLPLSAENLEWLEINSIIIAIGEIDTLGLNLDSFEGDLDLTIAAYIEIHNGVVARSREVLLPHADCSAISAYRNFDFSIDVLGDHGNPFDPNDTRHAFTISSDLVGDSNRSAAEHVQVLTAFYYLVAVDPRHPDTDRMRWAETVGQLADIRNTYGRERVSCYPGAVCRVARFSGSHPELALPDTLLNFIQILGRSLISNAITNYFELLSSSDYETRRNAYLALITFSSFNADAIRVHELTEVMGQSLTLLFYVRDNFLQTSLPLSVNEFIAQIEQGVEERYPGSGLSVIERALARSIFYNFSESACLSIRGNFQHTLTEEERDRFIAEDADTDHSNVQIALASSTSQIYTAYLSEREALQEEYDSIITHAQFLELVHTVALARVRVDCLSRFGVADHLAEQEIRDQYLTSMYRSSAEQLLRLRASNSSITWSDDEVNSRILGQISRNNSSLWFACSRPASGEIPECDEDTSDYTGESLQQAAIRLLLQNRFVAEIAPASAEPVANNMEVLRVARNIQGARATYENRNRRANLAAASDTESSMNDSMLRIGMTHFHSIMFPHLREEYRRYTLSSWLDLLDDELSGAYSRHAKLQALIDSLSSSRSAFPSRDGGIFGEEENFIFLRRIGALRDREGEREEALEEDERERIIEVDDAGDEEVGASGELASSRKDAEEYSITCILAIYEKILASDSIDLPDITERDVEVDLELDEDGDLELEYSSEAVVEVSNRILLMLRSKILDEIILDAGSAISPVSLELGAWLRENRSVIVLGDIDDVDEGVVLPDELRSYIFTHNAIVGQARRLLGSINCDSVNAWNCLDMRVSLAANSYIHPFNPRATRGSFIASSSLSASGQEEAANEAKAILSVVCLNAFEQGVHADLSGERFASIIGQLSDILNANGLRMASCYPGAIGRILKMADAHPVIAMPTDIPTFITNTIRGIFVPRITEYFQTNLQDASYARIRDVYLALMSFSSFYVDDILDGSMREAMGISLNRLVHAWNDVLDALLLGDPENIYQQVCYEVSHNYDGHQLNLREAALLTYLITDISPLIASAIRDLFLRTITPQDRLRFLQAEQEDDGDVYTCTEGQRESEIYTHYSRLYQESMRECGGEDVITRAIFGEIFNQIVDNILEIPSIQSMELSREGVIAEIRDYILQNRFASSARLMLSLRESTPSMADFTDERIANRVIGDIANEEFCLWFNCRQNREDRNGSEEDDFSLGSEPIEVAAMRLRLRQRFIQERAVVESAPVTSITAISEVSVISDHVRERANLRVYAFPERSSVGVEQVRCSILGMIYNRISNVDEVLPYSNILHLPALPVILPYHPTGRHGISHGSGRATRIFMALDTGLVGVEPSNSDLGVLAGICREFGVSESLESYDISCSVVVESYGFAGREVMLARAHPWLHSDAPETGSYNRRNSINVASIIGGRVQIIRDRDVDTHGGQRSSSSSVVFSPNNMHVWTPSEREFSDGELRENKVITMVFVESAGVGDARPRIKIATTVIVTPSTALALDGVLGDMRSSASEVVRGILARGSVAEILSYIDSQCRTLQLCHNMPLDVIREARLGAVLSDTGSSARGRLLRRNAFRISSSRRQVGRVFEYSMPVELSIADSDLTISLSRDLRVDSGVTCLEYRRLTNVGTCHPYEQSLSLPQLPMLHPYHPNGVGGLVRIDGGITRVLAAVEMDISIDRFNIAGIFGSTIGGLSDVPITTSIIVQNCPFNRNTNLLGRAHPWLHAEAPEIGNWNRQDTVRFAIISNDRVRVFSEGSVHTHGNSARDQVLFSPNNFRAVEISEDGPRDNSFYTTIFAVMEGGRVARLAVTTHVILTDFEAAAFEAYVSAAGLELTTDSLSRLLGGIEGFSAANHMPWRMVARGALAVQNAAEIESLPVVSRPIVSHLGGIEGFSAATHMPWRMVARGALAVQNAAEIESLPVVSRAIVSHSASHTGGIASNRNRRISENILNLVRGLEQESALRPQRPIAPRVPRIPRRYQDVELGNVSIIPEELRALHIESISEAGEPVVEALSNLQLFSNPDFGGRYHFIMPVMVCDLDEISHPLVAVTYNRNVSIDRLPGHVVRWLDGICSRSGFEDRSSLNITLNFCLQERRSDLMLSLAQAVQSPDQIEMLVSLLNDDGSCSEYRIEAGEFDRNMTRICYTGDGNTVYSCILFPSTTSIVLTQHLLAPEEVYADLASEAGRRLTTTRLENLLVYLRGNVPVEHLDVFEDFELLHRGVTNEFHALVSSGMDLICAASNVGTSVVNMGERHPNMLSRQGPLVYSSEGVSPLVPICLHFSVANRGALPEYVHRFISANELSFEALDIDVFFMAQSNPYVRGGMARLRFDALVDDSRSSTSLSSVINPRDEGSVVVHSNTLPGNIALEIFLREGPISFEALTLIRGGGNGARDRLILSMHCLLSVDMTHRISESLESLSELPSESARDPDVRLLSTVVNSLQGVSAIHRNLANFARMAYSFGSFPRPGEVIDNNFESTEVIPCYQLQFFDADGLRLRRERYIEDFIRFCIVAMPLTRSVIDTMEGLIENLDEEVIFFTRGVIESAIRYNNNTVLSVLYRHGINIIYPDIGRYGPVALCIELRHDECAVIIIEASLARSGIRASFDTALDEEAREYLNELGLGDRLDSALTRARFGSLEGAYRVVRSPSPIDMEGVAYEDRFEGVMRDLFRYIMAGDLENFTEQYNEHREELALRMFLGNSLVTYCAEQGQIELLEYLCSHGANINLPRASDNRTALHIAAASGNYDMIRRIIAISTTSRGARDAMGQTPEEVCRARHPDTDIDTIFRTEEEIFMSSAISTRLTGPDIV